MAKLSGINYLMLKLKDRIVKFDPDIYPEIINCNPDFDRKFNKPLAITENGYVEIFIARDPLKSLKLSRYIMNAKPGQIVDHINKDRLDNRRSNLRIVSSRQNNLNRKYKNRSGFTGVDIFRKKSGLSYYRAKFKTKDGKRVVFFAPFTYEGLILAAFARDKFVLQSGEEDYAPLNFPCFKKEPFRSCLLNEDLNMYKKYNKRGRKKALL
jgi:hypothetical protein